MTDLAPLRLIVLDVDGVLTDGTILLGGTHGQDAGEHLELKAFHTRDGAGLALWRDAGYHTTFLTGRGGAAVRQRARELRIERIWELCRDKRVAFDEILEHHGARPEEVVVMGDDLPDIAVLQRAGFSACPADAAPDIKARVDLVVPSRGGHGAVRDLVEHILRGRGEWDGLVESLM